MTAHGIVEIVAGTVTIRPFLPIADDRAVHDARVDRAHRLAADPELVSHPRAKAFENDIGGRYEAHECRDTGSLLEVEGEAALFAVHELKVHLEGQQQDLCQKVWIKTLRRQEVKQSPD